MVGCWPRPCCCWEGPEPTASHPLSCAPPDDEEELEEELLPEELELPELLPEELLLEAAAIFMAVTAPEDDTLRRVALP